MTDRSVNSDALTEHRSFGMSFEFVAIDVEVKDEPVSEDEAETNYTCQTSCAFNAAGTKTEEINKEEVDPASDLTSAVSMSSSTNNGHLLETSQVIQKEEEMETLDQMEESSQLPSCPLFENEELSQCAAGAFCQAEISEEEVNKPSEEAGSEGADKITRIRHTFEVPVKTRTRFVQPHASVVPVSEIRLKSFPCSECALILPTRLRLKKHLGLMHGKPFLCLHCSSAFVKSGELTMHMISHSVARLFLCPQCRAEFKDRKSLVEHLPSHMRVQSDAAPSQASGSTFWCRNCDAKFPTEQQLTEHAVVHRNDGLFPCILCPSKFKLKAHLVRHLKFHTDESLISCPHCTMKFKTERTFKLHSCHRSAGQVFSCNFCQAEFKFRSGLNSHLAAHSAERPFSCVVCTLAFKTKNGLKKHTTCCHVEENRTAFACEHCTALYKFKEDLGRHLKVHWDGKPFMCSYCSAKFTAKNSLKQHLIDCSKAKVSVSPRSL